MEGVAEVLAEMERVYQRILALGATGDEKVYAPLKLKEVLGLGASIRLAGKELPIVIASGNEWPGEQTEDDIIIR